jgi:hypothetical protein
MNIVDLTATAMHVIAPETVVEVDFIVANGGASTMPYMLLLSRVDLRISP